MGRIRGGYPATFTSAAAQKGEAAFARVVVTMLIAFGIMTSAALAAAPPPIWRNDPENPSKVSAQNLAIEGEEMQLPALVRPAAEFQKMLLQIRAGSEVTAWRSHMDRYAQNAGGDSVMVALRELARYWEARLAVHEIDRVLRNYYRENVQFPDRLDAVKSAIPEALRVDPWGEPWVYKPTVPEGFPDLQGQRYELGPTRFPHLSNLETAAKAQPTSRGWKLALREVSGNKALEIHTAEGKVAVVQPGARVGEVSLAYIGDGWALFADTEGLFTETF